MKKVLLLLCLSSILLGACATRSTQVRFAEGVAQEDKAASKLAFLYLNSDETITFLTYDAKEYASAMARFRKGDFLVFTGHVHDGPTWVALKPGIAYIALFKAGYTTGTMQVPLRGGSYYKVAKTGRSFNIAIDTAPNLDAADLEAQGIK
jgi:hypothetical protein